jgi:hypothetical protein
MRRVGDTEAPAAASWKERVATVTGEKTAARALAGLLALSLAAVAEASPGNGIRLGGSAARLHPYLELEGRYDSNLAYTSQAQKESGFILHVRPGLTLDSPTDPAAIDFRANLDWAQYAGQNSDLSRLYGDASLGIGINRRGTVGLELSDAFLRSSSTQVMSLGYAVVSNTNDLRVAIPFRPGGGAFVTTITGGWQLNTYEPFLKGPLCNTVTGPECDPSSVATLNYSDVSGGLELRWKFLPKTAAVVQGEYWKRMPANTTNGLKLSGYRGWAGLAGLFSTNVAGTVKGGWGSVTLSPGSESSWLANVEGEWIPLETASLKLGYLHDLGADPGESGVYLSHRGYLDGKVLLAARYTARLSGSYEHRDYKGAVAVQAANLISVSPAIDMELARWLTTGVGVAYTKRTSQVAPGTAALPGYTYDKTEAFVRLRGTY